ncbi:hypothetical protein CDAR_74271 [Caerostris darwini]|uniref:Uncharacterized protein n=1 Tax=Caerostris darwini TaxID=1538125 RepID=A0AAV4UK01_9ARAC|nr:hypothetical protein CDAR_74271 [Caerostris darwini]
MAISLPPRQGVMTLTMNYSDVSEHVGLKGGGGSRVTFYDGKQKAEPTSLKQQLTSSPPIINRPDPKTPSPELMSSSTSSEKVISLQSLSAVLFLPQQKPYCFVVVFLEREKKMAVSFSPRQGVMTLTKNYADVSEHVGLKEGGGSRVTCYGGNLNPLANNNNQPGSPPIINRPEPDPKAPRPQLIISSTPSKKVISQEKGPCFFPQQKGPFFFPQQKPYYFVVVFLEREKKKTVISLPPRQGEMTLTMNYSDVSEHVGLKTGEGGGQKTSCDDVL